MNEVNVYMIYNIYIFDQLFKYKMHFIIIMLDKKQNAYETSLNLHKSK